MLKFLAEFITPVVVVIFLLGTAYTSSVNRVISRQTRVERMMFLVNELTTTPVRQQIALNEIVNDGGEAVIYLFSCLNDERRLATSNVKFLNTHPRISEEYFLTEASSVGELSLRYLCWRTNSCDPGFDVNDETNKGVQREKLAKFCEKKLSKGIYPQFEARCR